MLLDPCHWTFVLVPKFIKFFGDNLGGISRKYFEGIHQEILENEKRYQDK